MPKYRLKRIGTYPDFKHIILIFHLLHFGTKVA